jgi:alpha-N-arabinofuranosidase
LRGIGGIDPSFFFDDANRAYVVHNDGPPNGISLHDGHRAIWMQQVDLQTGQVIGEKHLLVDGGTDLSKHPVWIEGPHIYHHNEFYYLIAAEGGTADEHSEVVFRSKELWGPYVPGPHNPILTQRDLPENRKDPVTCAGHADFVQLSDGDWWAVFLACRPYEDRMFNTGRETFLLPVHWHDGWPIILRAHTPIPRICPRPSLPFNPNASPPTTGTFTWKDSFGASVLDPGWVFIRTPVEKWYSIDQSLLILARPVGLDSTGNPSFVGRRQQHSTFSASVDMSIDIANVGCDAGLAAFQNESHWFFLGIHIGRQQIFLEQFDAPNRDTTISPTIIASVPLPRTDRIELKINAVGRQYSFWYRLGGQDWIKVAGDTDGSFLSTSKAGGFQGVTIGMFARCIS